MPPVIQSAKRTDARLRAAPTGEVDVPPAISCEWAEQFHRVEALRRIARPTASKVGARETARPASAGETLSPTANGRQRLVPRHLPPPCRACRQSPIKHLYTTTDRPVGLRSRGGPADCRWDAVLRWPSSHSVLLGRRRYNARSIRSRSGQEWVAELRHMCEVIIVTMVLSA